MQSIYDLSKIAGSNVQLSVRGKAVNGKEFFGSLSRNISISENIPQVDRRTALRKARNQVFVAALMGEDRLYRRSE